MSLERAHSGDAASGAASGAANVQRSCQWLVEAEDNRLDPDSVSCTSLKSYRCRHGHRTPFTLFLRGTTVATECRRGVGKSQGAPAIGMLLNGHWALLLTSLLYLFPSQTPSSAGRQQQSGSAAKDQPSMSPAGGAAGAAGAEASLKGERRSGRLSNPKGGSGGAGDAAGASAGDVASPGEAKTGLEKVAGLAPPAVARDEAAAEPTAPPAASGNVQNVVFGEDDICFARVDDLLWPVKARRPPAVSCRARQLHLRVLPRSTTCIARWRVSPVTPRAGRV